MTETGVLLSRDTIPFDIEVYIERLVAIAQWCDPAMLAQEEHQAQGMEGIKAFWR